MFKYFTFLIAVFIGLSLNAQTTLNDSVSVGPGYANQTFYSLANGTVASIDNSDWDLAFHTDNREVAIFVNSKKDVKLYLASTDTSKWKTLDTTNKTTKQFHNSDSSWAFGAFNREAPFGSFDYGWGMYNAATHEVYGTKIYFINYGANLWKKIMITKHDASYVYHFRYANLDGSNEVSTTITKATYNKKHMVYYSLSTNAILNREPDYSTYDLIFHQYEQEIPFYYKVVGVQQNRNVKAVKVYPVNDVNAAVIGTNKLGKNISTVGSDWKTFDVSQNKWVIEDSLVYFVQDISGAKIWKLVFTGYAGAATGKMYFNKTSYASGINKDAVVNLGLYPNPAQGSTTLNYFTESAQNVKISVKDLSGREVIQDEVASSNGFNNYSLNTKNLINGTYIIVMATAQGTMTQKLVVNN